MDTKKIAFITGVAKQDEDCSSQNLMKTLNSVWFS